MSRGIGDYDKTMTPILFEKDAIFFTTNGIGRLTDCLECSVTEERNGQFDLQMVYPTSGVLYSELTVGRIIVVKPNRTQERQGFEIYQITKPINQRVTVLAHHVSYRQSFIPIAPFSATGITETLDGLLANSLEGNPFSFTTNITNEQTGYMQNTLKNLRQCLGGTSGSVLDLFGGEYEWDNFETKLWLHRGSDKGVALRYAKNITDLNQEESIADTITGVIPYWQNSDATVSFYGDIQYTSTASQYAYHRTEILDLSSEFQTAPTLAELNQARQNYILRAEIGNPEKNIQVSFIDLSQTTEGTAILESVDLCDIVHVIYEPLGITYDAKVIKTVWDVLRDRYSSIEVGTVRSTFSKTIASTIGEIHELHLSNNRLISITQTINYELGEVQTTVARVDEELGGLRTTVTQTFNSYEIRIGNIEGTLDTYFDFTADGLIVGKSDSDVRGKFDNTSLQFIDQNDGRLRWLDAFEGLGATQLSIGTADTDQDDNYLKRWRIYATESGEHLRFTRHTE